MGPRTSNDQNQELSNCNEALKIRSLQSGLKFRLKSGVGNLQDLRTKIFNEIDLRKRLRIREKRLRTQRMYEDAFAAGPWC